MGDKINIFILFLKIIDLAPSLKKFIEKNSLHFKICLQKFETYEENNNDLIDEILKESLEEIFEATTEAKLDLIKDKDLSIEKENNIKKSLDKANEIFEEIKQIQENIEKIQEHKKIIIYLMINLMKNLTIFKKN